MGYALIAVAAGTVVFHVLSPWWWAPIASNWHYIDVTIDLTFWITGVAFVIILGFMAYCVFRFRHREGRRAEYEPESTKLEGILTVVTALAVAAMLAPGLFFWDQFIDVPEDAVEVEVVGQQWSWSYRLPGADGRLGAADTRRVSPDNPLGLNPDDPDGQDDIIINGGPLHLQVDTPVRMLLRSVDVLHNFYVPEFRAKMDMVPGMVTQLWFTRRVRGHSRPCVPSCAAPITPTCAARSWSRRRRTTGPGSTISGHSHGWPRRRLRDGADHDQGRKGRRPWPMMHEIALPCAGSLQPRPAGAEGAAPWPM